MFETLSSLADGDRLGAEEGYWDHTVLPVSEHCPSPSAHLQTRRVPVGDSVPSVRQSSAVLSRFWEETEISVREGLKRRANFGPGSARAQRGQDGASCSPSSAELPLALLNGNHRAGTMTQGRRLCAPLSAGTGRPTEPLPTAWWAGPGLPCRQVDARGSGAPPHEEVAPTPRSPEVPPPTCPRLPSHFRA